jgi:CRP/FNR family transcriptional regulator, anaerobic regulatory protein
MRNHRQAPSSEAGTPSSLSSRVDEAAALARIGAKRRLRQNETIFSAGDSADHAYKVISGTVRLCKHMADGRRQIAQFLFPGDYFSFLDLGEHNFSAETVTNVVLMSYPHVQIERLGEQFPLLKARFYQILSRRVLDIQYHLTMLGRQTAEEKLASFLLLLGQRAGSEDDNLVDVTMSRQDIADYLGLRVETVSRVLTSLSRQGAIDMLTPQRFALMDIEKLGNLADGQSARD